MIERIRRQRRIFCKYQGTYRRLWKAARALALLLALFSHGMSANAARLNFLFEEPRYGDHQDRRGEPEEPASSRDRSSFSISRRFLKAFQSAAFLERVRTQLESEHRDTAGFIILPTEDARGFRMLRLDAVVKSEATDGIPLASAENHSIVIPSMYLDQVRPYITQLWSTADVQVWSGGRLHSVEITNEGGDAHAVVHVDKHVIVELNERTNYSEFDMTVNAIISRRDARVVSFFDLDEMDTVQRLDQAVGDMHTALAPVDVRRWLNSLERWSGQVIFFVGHVEGDEFIMRDQHGSEMARLPITDIMAAAEKSHSSVLLLGCATAGPARNGYRTPVDISQIADALSSLRGDITYGELFQSLARASPDGLRFDAAFSLNGSLALGGRSPGIVPAGVALKAVTAAPIDRVFVSMPEVEGRARMPIVAWGAVGEPPFLLSVFGVWAIPAVWVIGAVGAILRPLRSWSDWRDAFPGKAVTYKTKLAKMLILFGRFALFVMLLPFVRAIQIIYRGYLWLFGAAILLMFLGAAAVPVVFVGFAIEIGVIEWAAALLRTWTHRNAATSSSNVTNKGNFASAKNQTEEFLQIGGMPPATVRNKGTFRQVLTTRLLRSTWRWLGLFSKYLPIDHLFLRFLQLNVCFVGAVWLLIDLNAGVNLAHVRTPGSPPLQELCFVVAPLVWATARGSLWLCGISPRVFRSWIDLCAIAMVGAILATVTASGFLTGLAWVDVGKLYDDDFLDPRLIVLLCGVGLSTGIATAWAEQTWKRGMAELPGAAIMRCLPSRRPFNLARVATILTRD